MTAMATYIADVGEDSAAWMAGPEAAQSLGPHGVSFTDLGNGRVSFDDETFRRLRGWDEGYECAIVLGLGGVPQIWAGGEFRLVVPLRQAAKLAKPPVVTTIAGTVPAEPASEPEPPAEHEPAVPQPDAVSFTVPLKPDDPNLHAAFGIPAAGQRVPGRTAVYLDTGDIAAALGLDIRTVQKWAARYSHRRTDEERQASRVPDFPHPDVTVGTGQRSHMNPAADGWLPERLAEILMWRAARTGPGWPSRGGRARVTWKLMSEEQKDRAGIVGDYQISSTGQVGLRPKRKAGR